MRSPYREERKKKKKLKKKKKKKKRERLSKMKSRERSSKISKKKRKQKYDSEKISGSSDSDVNASSSDSHSEHDNKSHDSRVKKVFVEGYYVQKEIAPLLKDIFSKYGDIVMNNRFILEPSKCCLLDLVCSIYNRLKYSKFDNLTPLEVESMIAQVEDLELVNVEVGWLHMRLDQISAAKEICKGASTLEDAKGRIALVIYEKMKAIESYEKELVTCASSTANEDLQERLEQEKKELALIMSLVDLIKPFYKNYLVHKLI